MDQYQALLDAYKILAKTYSTAWADPTEVPTQVALMLLNAREYIGEQIKQHFCDSTIADRDNFAISASALSASLHREASGSVQSDAFAILR